MFDNVPRPGMYNTSKPQPRSVKVRMDPMPVCCWLTIREHATREHGVTLEGDWAVVCSHCYRTIKRVVGIWRVVS